MTARLDGRKHRDWSRVPAKKRKAAMNAARRLYGRIYRARPEVKARLKAKRQKNRKKVRQRELARKARDPKAYLAMMAPHWMNYYYRLKQDPVRYAAYLERKRKTNGKKEKRARDITRQRERYAASQADPAKHETFLRERRDAYSASKALTKGGRGNGGSPVRIAAGKAEKANALLGKLRALVPAAMPEEVRDDLVNDLVVAVMAREVRLCELKDEKVLARYTRGARALLPRWGQLSLDDIVPGTDSLRYVDILPSDQPHL
jgi:hypothetical protein